MTFGTSAPIHAGPDGIYQGSILSPLLSNVYLHYVLDRWFRCRVRKQCRGQAYYFRFADDFVACFQYRSETANFRQKLGERAQEFALELAEDNLRKRPKRLCS